LKTIYRYQEPKKSLLLTGEEERELLLGEIDRLKDEVARLRRAHRTLVDVAINYIEEIRRLKGLL
jgi:hypothetical protein